MPEPEQRQTSTAVLRNVVFGLSTWVLPLALGLIATPILVGTLGHAEYGVYALILGLVGYSFTFNFGRAITKYIAEYRATGRADEIPDVISSSIVLNVGIGALGSVLLCLMAGWLVRDIFRLPESIQAKTVLSIYLASAIIFFTMLSQVFSSVLHGLQRFDVYSKIFALHSIALVLGNIIFALLGYGLVGLLSWNLALLGCFCVVYAVAARNNLSQFRLRLGVERKVLKRILAYSGAIVVYQILGNLVLLFERGWITQRLGSESLTYYVVPMSLGLYLHGFISSLVMVLFPLASELEHDRPRLRQLYTKATKLITALVLIIVVSVLINREGILTLWMGADFAGKSSSLLVPHMICFGLVAVLTISWQLTEGLGRPQFNAILTGISTVICISLMLMLIAPYGSLGVAVGRLIGFAVIFFSIFLAEMRFFGSVQSGFWLRHVGQLAVAAGAAALVEYLIVSYLTIGWPTLVGSMGVGVACYAVVLWLFDFVTPDEKLLFRKVLGRKT